MKEFEPLLKEDKDKLFFSSEEKPEKETKIEEAVKTEEYPDIPEYPTEEKETSKREIVDAADEIRKTFTREIAIPIVPEEKKETKPELTEESKEEVGPLIVEDQTVLIPTISEDSIIASIPTMPEAPDIPEVPKMPDLNSEEEQGKPIISDKTEILTFPQIEEDTEKEPLLEVNQEAKLEIMEPSSSPEESKKAVEPAKESEKNTEDSKEKSEISITEAKEESDKKDVEEEQETEGKDKKQKIAIIVTIIFGIITFWLLFITVRNFYMGFKYKDYDPTQDSKVQETATTNNNNNNTTTPKEGVISLTDAVLQDTYNKYKTGLCTNTANVINRFYTDTTTTLAQLTDEELGAIVFNNVPNLPNCESGETTTVDVNTVHELFINLFNSDTHFELLTQKENYTYGNLNVSYNSESGFTIGYISCNVCENINDFTMTKLENATTQDNYLYVYERFGYFASTGENNYDVYKNTLKTEIVAIHTGEKNSFKNTSELGLYKWTFKKGANDTYYFVSIEPTI